MMAGSSKAGKGLVLAMMAAIFLTLVAYRTTDERASPVASATSSPSATTTGDGSVRVPLPKSVVHNEDLGIEFKYPSSWVEGTRPSPYVSCFGCTVVGPAEAAHPYGIQLFRESLSKGCGVTCYVGNRALPEGEERSLTVGGRDASQVEIERQAPLGLVSQTDDDTPYREKWTLIPLEDRALFLVAFYRSGDTTAEVETESAYDGLLASLVFLPETTDNERTSSVSDATPSPTGSAEVTSPSPVHSPTPEPTINPTPVLPNWVRSAPLESCLETIPENLRSSPDFKPRSCFIVDGNPASPQRIVTFEFQRQGYAAVSHGNWDELLSPQVLPASIIPELLPTGTTAPIISRFVSGSVCWEAATGHEIWRVDLESGATAGGPSRLPTGADVLSSCGVETPVPLQNTPAPVPSGSDFLRVPDWDYWCNTAARTLVAPRVTGAVAYEILDCRKVSTGGRGTLWLFRLNGRLGVALIGFVRVSWITDATGSTEGFDGLSGTLACWHDSSGRAFGIDLIDGALEENPSECGAISIPQP